MPQGAIDADGKPTGFSGVLVAPTPGKADKRNSPLRVGPPPRRTNAKVVDDPELPVLREILKEHNGPLSITWLLCHFNISYGRGGRLESILQTERNLKAPMKSARVGAKV